MKYGDGVEQHRRLLFQRFRRGGGLLHERNWWSPLARGQKTGCELMMLGSQVEKYGKYVTMLIALKIAR